MSSEPTFPVRVRFPDGTERMLTLVGPPELGNPLRTIEAVNGFWVITSCEPSDNPDDCVDLEVGPL